MSMMPRKPGAHHMVGQAALARIGHLAGDDGGDLFGRHAAALAHAGELNGRRRRDDDDPIDPIRPAGLEQQGDIQHHQRHLPPARAGQEAGLGGADHRVQDRLQPAQGGGVADHRCP
jgi:hypothetical protein